MIFYLINNKYTYNFKIISKSKIFTCLVAGHSTVCFKTIDSSNLIGKNNDQFIFKSCPYPISLTINYWIHRWGIDWVQGFLSNVNYLKLQWTNKQRKNLM